MIASMERALGKRIVTIYKPTQEGIEFSRTILEPYEKLFPRKKAVNENKI
ncbi:MAG: hypothetical protein ACRDFB_04120 [Rhabdochlamydiaceae bacterium]